MVEKQEQQYQVSQQDLAAMGINHLAYIKSVEHEGETLYAVHAADGTQMALMRDREVAKIAVRQHDLEPVSVH